MRVVRRRRRGLTELGLSFLDCICCGFGAVILLFMIVDHASEQRKVSGNERLLTPVAALEDAVLDARQTLLMQQAAVDDVTEATRLAEAEARRLREQIEAQRERRPTLEDAQRSSRTRVDALQQELLALESRIEALRAQAQDAAGNAIREVRGEGVQRYLSGLVVEGRHILLLVDTSASMLGYRIVDVVRTRNLPQPERARAPKWQRTLAAVDWLSAQIPEASQFQIIAFNVTAAPVLAGSEGSWLPARGGQRIDEAMAALRKRVPENGTSLHAAFTAAAALRPAPDAIYLITDGLPTQGARPQTGAVSGTRRLRHFNDAVGRLPRSVPVHVLLLPMEGDPRASGAYWNLARARDATFLAPSKDWP
jgi:hypothetical protein